MPKVSKVSAPNLIVAPNDYSKSREEQLNNELRLYFNRLNTYLNLVADTAGGSAISFPHIAAYSDADQYAGGDDTPTIVTFNNASDNVGFTFNADGTATSLYDGTYKIEYRLQAVNTDNTTSHNAVVWMQIDGVNLANSTTVFTLPSAPSAVTPTYKSLNAFITWEAVAGQSVALYWATNKAAVSGGSNGVYLEYEGAQTTPYSHPEVPSAYGVIQYIGRE